MFFDKSKGYQRLMQAELDEWKKQQVDDGYFYSRLDPFISCRSADLEKKILTFVIVDMASEMEFITRYNKTSKMFKVKSKSEPLKFLDEKIQQEVRGLSRLLKKVLDLYLSQKKLGGKGLPPTLKLKKTSDDKPLTRKQIEDRATKEFRGAWKKYLTMGSLSNRQVVQKIMILKKVVMPQLIAFLKDPLPHSKIIPVNTFHWIIQLGHRFFHNPLSTELNQLKTQLVLDVRFRRNYPINFPFVRIVEPKLTDHELISYGGVLLDEFSFKTIRGFLKGFRIRARKHKYHVDFSSSPSFELYDETLAKVDYRRLRLHRNPVFMTVNNFQEKLVAVPPIFAFENPSKQESIEYGNKVVLPPACFTRIFQTNPNVETPLLFEVQSKRGTMFCGVREFTAPAGQVIMPSWMFRSLKVSHGDLLKFRCVRLRSCTHLRLMPLDPFFFKEVKNYKTLLESQMRQFFCMTIGDSFPVKSVQKNKEYIMHVVGLKPDQFANSIVAGPSGFLELSLEVVPPPNFDPELHRVGAPRMLGMGGEKDKEEGERVLSDDSPGLKPPERTLADLEDEVKSPLKVDGKNYTKCENCGKSVLEYAYRMHLPHCKDTYMRCGECNKIILKEDEKSHHEEFHATYPCPKCGIKLEQYKMYKHRKQECVRRIVHCQYLNCPVEARLIADHESKCGSQTEKCAKCGKYVYLKNKAVHSVSCLWGGTTDDPSSNPRAYLNKMSVGERRALYNRSRDPGLSKISDYDYQMAKAIEMSMKNKEKEKEDKGEVEESEEDLKDLLDVATGQQRDEDETIEIKVDEEEDERKSLPTVMEHLQKKGAPIPQEFRSEFANSFYESAKKLGRAPGGYGGYARQQLKYFDHPNLQRKSMQERVAELERKLRREDGVSDAMDEIVVDEENKDGKDEKEKEENGESEIVDNMTTSSNIRLPARRSGAGGTGSRYVGFSSEDYFGRARPVVPKKSTGSVAVGGSGAGRGRGGYDDDLARAIELSLQDEKKKKDDDEDEDVDVDGKERESDDEKMTSEEAERHKKLAKEMSEKTARLERERKEFELEKQKYSQKYGRIDLGARRSGGGGGDGGGGYRDTSFKCCYEGCDERLSSEAAMVDHTFKAHAMDNSRVVCPLCKKEQANFKQHLGLHHIKSFH